MKVKIEFTVDIDPKDWALNFGTDIPAVIRADVQERARYIVTEQFRQDGVPVR